MILLKKIPIIAAVLLVSLVGIISTPIFAQTGALDYDIRGGEVTGIEIDDENNSLIIQLDTRTRGEITITLPRNLIDAKTDFDDTEFEIKVSGLSLNFFDETKSEQDRTITIPFSRSDYDVVITGTHLFGQDNSKSQVDVIEDKINQELRVGIPNNQAKLLIFSDTQWTGVFQSSTFPFTEIKGSGDDAALFTCESSISSEGIFGAKVQKLTRDGYLKIVVIQNNEVMSEGSTEDTFGEILVNGNCSSDLQMDVGNGQGGGCLIATATFGSEMAPQVQQLREIRDNKLLQTESGTVFLDSFNEFYYSFSPTIADYQRENPVFKEFVRLAITPLITSLSILNYVDVDSEEKVLGYGISILALNVMMYFGIPIIAVLKLRR